jgi:hypothetical protein
MRGLAGLRRVLIVGALACLLSLASAAVASAAEQNTGQDCVQEYYFDGQGIQHLGSRCARASVVYFTESSVLWYIDYYQILYSVTAGLSYGPHNNENPARVASGFNSGQGSGLSPDNGATNAWINRTYWGSSYTYRGQTVFAIDAYPDIPDVGDPDLQISTASW